MADKINFTKGMLETLLPAAVQYEVRDTKIRNLRLRVNPGGSKTFILYRKVNGKPRRIRLASLEDTSVEKVRKKAESLNGQIAEGHDPQDEKAKLRRELTFAGLFDIYYREHALVFNRAPQLTSTTVMLHLLPQWGHLKLSAITPETARKLHLSIADKCAKAKAAALEKSKAKLDKKARVKPAMTEEEHLMIRKSGRALANRAITLAGTIFNFAIREHIFQGQNPCVGVKKFRLTSRDRFLSTEEIQRFASALEDEDDLFRDFFMLAVLTGARKASLLSMRFDEIDFGLRRWRIPDSKAKNGDVNIVPLSLPALSILKERQKANSRLESPSPFVFPGNGKQGHLHDPKKAFRRIRARMGTDDIRIHDLRRTLGSYMAISGASLSIIGKALNHKSQASTAIYARLSQSPVLEAVDAAAKLMQMSS